MWSCKPSAAMRLLEGPIWSAQADVRGHLGAELPAGTCALAFVDAPEAPAQVMPIGSSPDLDLILPVTPPVQGRAIVEPPDSRGEICARGEVKAESIRRTQAWQRCATLSPGGAFVLRGVPTGALDYRLEVAGYLPLEGSAIPAKSWTLRPVRGRSLHGTVVGPARERVAGAAITAPGAVATTSDARGEFVLTVAALPAEVTIRAEGFEQRKARLEAPPGPAGWTVQLERGMWIEGDLVDEQGQAIAEASISLQRKLPRGAWDNHDFEVRDERGAMRIEVGEAGSYRARVRAAGYRPLWLAPLEVVPGATLRLGVIGLDRGIVVRGRFVDGDRRPVRGVRVRAEPHGAAILDHLTEGFASAVSDREGAFELTGLGSGSYDLLARREGAGTLQMRLDLSGTASEDLGDLFLDQPEPVHGRVVDRAGRPRSGLTVELFDANATRLLPLDSWVTDEEGRFEAELAIERYVVRVVSDHVLLAQQIEISHADEEQKLELTVPGVAVHGRVRRGPRAEGPGQLVLVQPTDPGLRGGLIQLVGGDERRMLGGPTSVQHAEVDAAGRFEISDVNPGQVRFTYLDLQGRRWVREQQIADQAEAYVEVDLGGADLEGFVHEAGSKDAVAGARVQVVADLGDTVAETVSRVDGTFEIPEMEPGLYSIALTAEGFAATSLRAVQVAVGGEPVDVPMRRAGEGELRIHLTRFDGSPGAFDFVTVLDASGAKVRAFPTDASGRFVVPDLPPGTYALVWQDPLAGTGAEVGIEVPREGGGADFERTLPEGVDLQLECAVCGGRSTGSIWVFSAGALINGGLPALGGAGRFSETGTLDLGRVTAGASYLLAWSTGERIIRKPFVASGEMVTVALP